MIHLLDVYRVLRSLGHGPSYQPDEWIMPYLDTAGFESATLIRVFELRANLISILVEQRCPETHTFHLSCGECTITLKNVTLQLGLSVDGDVVTSSSPVAELAALYCGLLGCSSGDGRAKFMNLKV
ncbi:hypothetical protein J1N35_014017 [Gossypium stocksii]|uniref:Aminotransferase-like plant mobile domain-containing protein n=1 Tax=Gossypium stocksii TaxID=47602 RepID=A0A9D3VVR0_9ROSI|nr:hypothetical protein J1N35_014017 [Gossypium stocksii]